MSKIGLLRSISALLAVGFAISTSMAHAETSPTTCDGGIPWVDFDYTWGGRVLVGCISGGTEFSYFGMVNGGTACANNVSIDVVKTWKATADEALLSGKKLIIYWSACSDGRKQITSMSLRR
jgi:hypothetical protein